MRRSLLLILSALGVTAFAVGQILGPIVAGGTFALPRNGLVGFWDGSTIAAGASPASVPNLYGSASPIVVNGFTFTGHAMQFAGTTNYGSIASLPSAGAITILASYNPNVPSTAWSQGWLISGYDHNAQSGFNVLFGVTTAGKANYARGDNYQSPTSATYVTQGYKYLAITQSGTAISWYLNGVADGTATAAGNLTQYAGPFKISSRADSIIADYNGAIYRLAIYNRAMSGTEVAALLPHMSGPPMVVFDGDSLTSGEAVATVSLRYPNQTAALVPQWEFVNSGVSGHTCAQQYSAFSATPNLIGLRKARVSMLWCGTNDIVAGTTPATIYATITSYVAAVHAVGALSYIGTILPRDGMGATNPAFETARQSLNTLIRANTAGADQIIDIGADANIGQAGQEDNATYYVGDGVHLNATGNAIPAALVAAKLKQIAIPQ